MWALIGMILFHLTGNVWSDYFDFKKKVDAEDTFGAKTLTTGMFQPAEILRLAIVLLCLSVVCGLGLFAVTVFADNQNFCIVTHNVHSYSIVAVPQEYTADTS